MTTCAVVTASLPRHCRITSCVSEYVRKSASTQKRQNKENARAGVGRLTLTDNDVLTWGNIGRHILGADYIGRSKAEALAERLLQELPHLNIVGINKNWREALTNNPDFIETHDLVISTTADWRCERPLNQIMRTGKAKNLVFGWIEPYAVAGHCLVLGREGGCFECGANEFGQFSHAVASFANATIHKEPGGCANYQRYGPVAMMPVVSLVASTVIESLLSTSSNSCLNTWVSSRDQINSNGATLTECWKPQVETSGYSRVFQKTWTKSKTCLVCTQAPI